MAANYEMDEIALVKTKKHIETDKSGREKIEYASREVFCYEKSVGMSEYYRAQSAGTKVSIIIGIRKDEYDESIITREDGKRVRPSEVEKDGILYKIERAYKIPESDIMEFTLVEVE